MKVIEVNGGIPLFGEVNISGSKNAALPVIFATLVARGKNRIEGIPKIGDTQVALDIIRSLGAEISREGNTLIIDTENVEYSELDRAHTSKIRASTYLLGSCLGRFAECRLCDFGGCAFSDRPIDMHIQACEAFGGKIDKNVIKAPSLHSADVTFGKPSVGATINALILAASVKGKSTVSGFAKEPHVLSLCDFLRSAGAKIEIDGEKITVCGGDLHGGDTKIIPDMIEAGTYLSAAVVTGGEVTVRGADPTHLEAFLSALESMGASLSFGGNSISAKAPRSPQKVNVRAQAYPGFPTDLQPIIAPSLAVCRGGNILDTVWRERYGYLEVLTSFGVKYKMTDGGAQILRSSLKSASVSAPDLRGGMAAVLCALGAFGKSRIGCAEYILRGYEDLSKKLGGLGAKIKIFDE